MESTCRQCGLTASPAFYVDNRNRPTKKPICRDCYERAIARSAWDQADDSADQKDPGYQYRLYHGRWAEM